MDLNTPEVRARMPLAEATLLIFRHITDPEFLTRLFDEHRGRHYTRELSFPQMIDLIADCLLRHDGSGRRGFETARQDGQMKTSIQAAYGKLRRMPIEVSTAFLAAGTDRLQELCPPGAGAPLPDSLTGFHVIAVDGKTVKWVQKRLKALRNAGGGVIGGKALVALSLSTGLALVMQAHPDGDANEVQFIPQVTEAVRTRIASTRLWMADRAFGYPIILSQFGADGDAFVVRARAVVTFEPDRPPQVQTDAQGRRCTQEWGWLGQADSPHRCRVRRMTLEREDAEPIVLLTNLLDPQRYPAPDLLNLYRMRWGIERVFQQITEVFGLKALIGSSPEATLFQLAFCLLIYNVTLVTKAYIAVSQKRALETISTEKLFDEVTDHLIAWNLFFPPPTSVEYLAGFRTAEQVRERLHGLLNSLWTPVWLKAPTQRRHPHPPSIRNRAHTSVYRALRAATQPLSPDEPIDTG